MDTNVIIHLYRADLQDMLFDFFSDGVFIYEQIRNIELVNHGRDILEKVDADIACGKIDIYTDDRLKKQSVFKIFQINVKENRNLYGKGDLGEVYAISLAQTLGAYALVTDDTKQGGPYMSLLQLDYGIMPFTFSDILILRYLLGNANEFHTIEDFERINRLSGLNWSFKSQIIKFIKRFWKEPYKKEEKLWIDSIVRDNNIRIKSKFTALRRLL